MPAVLEENTILLMFGHLPELLTSSRTKYINNLANIRDEESSIELPGIRKQTDGNLEVSFWYTIEKNLGPKRTTYSS